MDEVERVESSATVAISSGIGVGVWNTGILLPLNEIVDVSKLKEEPWSLNGIPPKFINWILSILSL